MRFFTPYVVPTLALGLLATQVAAAPNDNNIKHPTYKSLLKRDPITQSEILRRADPASQAQVWVDRVEAYRTSHADKLSPEQSAVLDSAVTSLKSGDKSGLQRLKQDAISAFGFDEAKAIATTLDGNTAKRPLLFAKRQDLPQCECATVDSWCADGFACLKKSKACHPVPDDCGWWNAELCDGLCYPA
ncbi:hypothetical protein AJ79_07896 [Helicocarpus griseus UAMH5409]|uniref:Uncharacterized protein n=1 Tax=Helicocarpus griseus UAMH5409 TaxID=1447875 RepID=A0A2B7WYQ4_9EURO|nr:hypothetical protein AJ79_07896 [Helicocarpus griseus UAMH5409]